MQIPELCVDENDENSSRKKGRTIALEPITDTKLCQTMTFVRTEGVVCKNWKNLSWIKNFLRRRVPALEPLAQCIIHRRCFGVLSKHTLPKSLNFPFLRASRYTLCLSDYFFVRTRIEFINYAKYKFLCTRSRTKNLSQQLFSRSHNLPSPASEESRGNYFCACYNTVIIT